MIPLKAILSGETVLKKLVLNQEQDIKLRKNWGVLFGQLAQDVAYGFFKDGVIHLEVSNPLWVNEIAFYKPHILEKANGLLGKKIVKDLKIRTQLFKKIDPEIKQPQPQPKSLEERIKLSVEEKIKKGWVLCSGCQKMYVKTGLCLFCLSEQAR